MNIFVSTYDSTGATEVTINPETGGTVRYRSEQSGLIEVTVNGIKKFWTEQGHEIDVQMHALDVFQRHAGITLCDAMNHTAAVHLTY